MPPAGAPLAPEHIQVIREWIDAGAAGLPQTAAVTRQVDFTADVAPLLRKNCYGCHSGTQPKAQFRVDVPAGLLKGGLGGAAVVAGKSAESRLMHRLEGKGGEQRMPLKGEPLSAEQMAVIRAWIDQGARVPEATEKQTVQVEKHWAYKKPVRPAVPNVEKASNPIDAFLLAKLAERKMTFSPQASTS